MILLRHLLHLRVESVIVLAKHVLVKHVLVKHVLVKHVLVKHVLVKHVLVGKLTQNTTSPVHELDLCK